MILKKILRKSKIVHTKKTALEILSSGSPFNINLEQRADMTISCKDSDYIPKVKNAGKIKKKNKLEVQVMHNGLLVLRGGYYGEWMERIIRELKGHHEPQEEKVFNEILKRLSRGSTMIELGSFWAYYSLWFNKNINNAKNICCEPDLNNIKIGIKNSELNNASIDFIEAAAGSVDGKIINFPLESEPGKTHSVKIRTVDSIVDEKCLDRVDVLHMDVQGEELNAIQGALKTIANKKLRFLIVSTHHYSISGDPLTHNKCLSLIKSLGGHIISEHSVLESYSGDGLIAASFDIRDRNFKIKVSINSSNNSLYRPYEEDLALLVREYNGI